MKIFKKSTLRQLKEAVSADEMEKIINQYASKTTSPEGKKQLVRQAMNQIGKTSSVSPEDLGMSLRKFYAQKLDPAKVAKKQAVQGPKSQPGQQTPPPLPGKSAITQPVSTGFASPGKMPSLSDLASQEQPWHKKLGLPDIEDQPQVDKPFIEPPSPKQFTPVPGAQIMPSRPSPALGGEEEDIPMAKPGDFRAVKSPVAKKRSAAAKSFVPPGAEPAPVMPQTAAPEEPAAKKVSRGRPKQPVPAKSTVATPNLSRLAYRKSGKFI